MPNPYPTLREALLVILNYRYMTASEIVEDLRSFEGAGRLAFQWKPGNVLDELDQISIAGQVEQDKSRGYRLMPERVKAEPQRSMF